MWDLRLKPDLSLYRRAYVNLLLACSTDVRKHPDKSKFAQECIDLIAQVRHNGLADHDTEEELVKMEKHAEKTLIHIEGEVAEVEARAKARKARKAAAQNAQDSIQQQVKPEDVGALKSTVETIAATNDNTGERAWTIEGSYTDRMIGKKPDTS